MGKLNRNCRLPLAKGGDGFQEPGDQLLSQPLGAEDSSSDLTYIVVGLEYYHVHPECIILVRLKLILWKHNY